MTTWEPKYLIRPLVTEYLIIFCMAALPWWLYPVSLLIIGSRLHAIGVLLHETIHGRSLRFGKWTETFNDVFMAFPILLTFEGYRRQHVKHHAELTKKQRGMPNDDPKHRRLAKDHYTDRNIRKKLIGYAFGKYIWRDVHEATVEEQLSTNVSAKTEITRVLFWAVVLSVAYYFSALHLVLFYWIAPLLFVVLPLTFFRSKAEHQDTHAPYYTRTTLSFDFLDWLIAPYNIGYHIEHHLHAGIPWYSLPAYRNKLIAESNYVSDAQVSPGYAQVYKELSK